MSKKPKTVQCWDRDIVCIPRSRLSGSGPSYSYPRGRYRTELGRLGFIGKIHITSDMDETAVKLEICSVYEGHMGGYCDFPFVFLQSAGGGSKTLVIPAQSSNYKWNGQQVSRLAGQTGTMYILAQAAMPSLNNIVS